MGEDKRKVRKKEEGKRTRKVAIKLSVEEHQLLDNRSQAAGLYMAAYVRKMIFKGKVIPRFTEEEKGLFRGLIDLSNTLHQLQTIAQNQGCSAVTPTLEIQCALIDQLLKKFKQ